MPVYQKFYIGAPSEQLAGQITRYKPFLLPSGAFEQLQNAYIFREVNRKRPGALVMDTTQAAADQQLYTRLRVNIGTTNGSGNLAGNVPGAVFKVGQMFSIGSVCYTVYNPGAGALAMYRTDGTTTATYNLATGAYNFVGAPATTAVYFYPSEPVMHYGTYDTDTINRETTIAFDTQFSYTYTAGSGWSRLTGGAAANTWTAGANKDDYFWSTTWRGTTADTNLFYVTNNVAADAMRYYDGTNWNAWGSLATTPLGGGNYIVTALIIMPFEGSLLLLNTTEFTGAANATFVNRIRYSASQQTTAPNSATAWLISNDAGFIDIPTKEQITSAYYLMGVIVVECERSTWRLSFTGNKIEPFIIEQINTELGVESTNSMVGFDRGVIGFGQTGIHICNGQNVERIDEMIPDTIFDVSNDNSGPQRVGGIRDYFNEMVYWTYNSQTEQSDYNLIWPNRFLIFDYNTKAWAYCDDSISAFGYYWKQTAGTVKQVGYQSILCGNQQGWTFRLRDDVTRNSSSLQITNLSFVTTTVTITSPTHNLTNGSYVYIANVVGTNGAYSTQLNGKIFQVTTTTVDAFTITVDAEPTGDVYRGCGTIERVSEWDILTKDYNFFGELSKSIAFMQCNFYVDKTDNGEFTVDFIPSASSLSLLTDATASGAIMGTNILETTPYTLVNIEQFQERFWHSVTFQATGEYVQLHMYLSDAQITDPDIAFSDIQINGMIFFVAPIQDFA